MTPKAPAPVTVDSVRVLVYELHVTNFGAASLALRQLDIMDAGAPETPLASYGDSALRRMVAPAGAIMADTVNPPIGPGYRAIVFVWLPIAGGRRIPRTLRHRLRFAIADSGDRHGDQPAEPSIDSIMVNVSSQPVPVLRAPLRGGQWVAGDAPSNTSDHRRSLVAIGGRVSDAQRFAIDWTMVGPNGDTHHGDEQLNQSYWGYGQPVRSVAAGTVVAAIDSIGDHTPHTAPPPTTLATIAGNYVMVRIASREYATYAHLQRGSIRVRVGQRVHVGDVIGRLGLTGQSTGPHLHFQLTDGPSVLGSEGIPYVLAGYTDLGPGREFEEGRHPSVARRHALPEEDEVVGLP